jgi:MFS family permease
VAAIAVGFTAADTYVVVLALPDMMASVGLSIDQLQRGAPVVSGFLLGYVAMLPLIGKIADLRGRVPVLVGSLLVFSVGSLVTACSYDLVSMVVGRFLQGAGGGGLVPATLALVADIWAVERRGVPLGVVGAVQELGSVVGPLYGALVIAAWSWRAIFWLNLGLGVALAVTVLALSRRDVRTGPPRPAFDWPGALLGALALAALALVLTEPTPLASGLTTGRAYIRYAGDSRWSTPMALACFVLAALFVLRQATARHPLFRWREWRAVARSADVVGAVLLSLSLAGIVLAFASANPEVQVLSPAGPWLLAGSAAAGVAFAVRQRLARAPLLPAGALRARPAWGALVVNLSIGAALIAALVDIPVFARVTVYPGSQLDAALVLMRLLVAIPVGALAGGYLSRRMPYGVLAAAGMAMSCLGFCLMTRWGATSLHDASPTFALVVCGLGFGIAIAPVNAALLAATEDAVHGLASALLVVARMVGMLVGISTLTAIGLHRFYAVSAAQPPLHETCPDDTLCDAYVSALKQAGIAQMHAIFWGAAVASATAAVLALVLLSRPVRR